MDVRHAASFVRRDQVQCLIDDSKMYHGEHNARFVHPKYSHPFLYWNNLLPGWRVPNETSPPQSLIRLTRSTPASHETPPIKVNTIAAEPLVDSDPVPPPPSPHRCMMRSFSCGNVRRRRAVATADAAVQTDDLTYFSTSVQVKAPPPWPLPKSAARIAKAGSCSARSTSPKLDREQVRVIAT